MKGIRLWPHITVALVVALLAGLGVAFWIKQDRTASAEELPHAARIQRVDGEVAFADGLADSNANPEWVAATPNQPFSVGDRIYTRDNARTSLAFSGRNFARLDPNTSLDVVSLGDRRTQLALREGSAIFDVGYLAPGELFEVGTPYGAVNFDEPGLYNVGFDDNGGVLVSVLSGLAQVVGLGGTGQINKGEVLTLIGQTAAQIALSRLNGDDAGYLVDDYYRYQYPNTYDGRYSSYDAYLNDPYYYDPYRRYQSYQYVNSIIPGINDLDYYGDWQNVDGYGYAWRPRVDSGWVPYQQGYWVNDYPYGPTWVSSEPWGYAPYHYGRWANVGNQWYWIPAGVNTTPQYAPALVAFVPLDDVNQIGWVPLGPGDIYAPRYYDENWQPHYLTRATVLPAQLINIGIPDAVTVVPLDAFGRPIDPRVVRRIELQRLASVRSTLDPLTLTPLRNAVIHSAWGRGKIDLPPGIAKKLRETPVYVGQEVRDPRYRRDLAKSMRVERVSDKAKNQKFKVKDSEDAANATNGRDTRGRSESSQRADQRLEKQQNEGRTQEKTTQAPQQTERTQRRAIRAQQRTEEKAQRKAQQQPQAERVANPARHQPQGELMRQPVRARGENSRPQARQQTPQTQPAQKQNKGGESPEFKGPPAQAAKQERKQSAAVQSSGNDQGDGGKGKAKGKGKP